MLKKSGKRFKIILGIILCAVLLCGAQKVYAEYSVMKEDYRFEQTGEAMANPLMGFAVSADYYDAVAGNTLVYVDVTWQEWEPEEGVYDIEGVIEDNSLEEWKELGKHAVFRFMCDEPQDEEHMDIPEWLYEQTGDGRFYDMEYGKGYAPDYNNTLFIEKHARAVKALGEAFGKDDFFAYIQMGSLGHWGEWHVKYDEGLPRIPAEAVRRQYIEPFIQAFPNAILLTRRPFAETKDYGMGIYNDMAGFPEDTLEWLDWIANGGEYMQPEVTEKLTAQPEIWKKKPIGGEFTSAIPWEDMLVNHLDRTLSLLDASHMTFIGPKCPVGEEEELYKNGAEEVLKHIGYRYGVKEASIHKNRITGSTKITLQVCNYGAAPIYFPWKLYYYVMDGEGNILLRTESELNLMKLGSGGSEKTSATYRQKELPKDMPLYLGVGIVNPQTGMPEVKLDMKTESIGNVYIIGKINTDPS